MKPVATPDITAENIDELLEAMREAVNEVPSYVERSLSDEEEQGYYCGLCKCFMPLSHFPH